MTLTPRMVEILEGLLKDDAFLFRAMYKMGVVKSRNVLGAVIRSAHEQHVCTGQYGGAKTRLVRAGYIAPKFESGRKCVYKVTDSGMDALTAHRRNAN